MHKAVKNFVGHVKHCFPQYFTNKKVIELGSLNINGTIRDLFTDCDYTGVDYHEGKDVDLVMPAHELWLELESVDMVISCEMLEHDPYWRNSLLNAIRILKPGGMLLVTCAGIRREIHEVDCGIGGHYQNITKRDIYELLGEHPVIYLENDYDKRDLRFYLIK